MENIKIIIFLSLLPMMNLLAQKDSITPELTQKLTIKPDSETKYYDENKREITQNEYRTAQETGKFMISPVLSTNSKVISLGLVRLNPSLPDFSEAISFTGKTLEGENISMEKLKGKVVVINFWFIACAPCVKEMPDLNQLHEKYRENPNVVFLAPTFENAANVKDFLKTRDFKYTIVPDAKNWIKDYKISVYPTHLVVDREGTIVFSQVNTGKKAAESLEKAIDSALLKKAKRIVQDADTSSKMTVTNDGDEPIEGMFMMTNKTVIFDENGNKIDNKTAGELLNTQKYLPFKRKTKGGEIIVIKKVG